MLVINRFRTLLKRKGGYCDPHSVRVPRTYEPYRGRYAPYTPYDSLASLPYVFTCKLTTSLTHSTAPSTLLALSSQPSAPIPLPGIPARPQYRYLEPSRILFEKPETKGTNVQNLEKGRSPTASTSFETGKQSRKTLVVLSRNASL